MATKFGDILGIKWLREDPAGSGVALVEIAFTMPAYTASSDNGQLGGNSSAGSLHGAANDTLVTILQNDRRDGKTVALSAFSNQAGVCSGPGLQGSTSYYAAAIAVATSNVTFNVANSSGSEIDAASGVSDEPISVVLQVTLT